MLDFADGEGFPTLRLLTTPAGRRVAEVVAAMYKDNLNIDIELDVKDFTVLIEDANRMNYDLLALGQWRRFRSG